MPKPWERYQTATAAPGQPWAQYGGAPAPPKPASRPWTATDVLAAPLGVGEALLQAPIGSVVKDISQAAVSPVAGAVSAARGQGFEKGYQESAQGFENAYQRYFAPQTRVGQGLSDVLSYPFRPLAKVSDYLGKKVTDITGSKAAGEETKAITDIGEAALLRKAGQKAPEALQKVGDLMEKKPTLTATQAKTLREAQKQGFVVAPASVGTKPMASALQGVGGKAAVEQMADIRNAKVLASIAKKELGIPSNQDITPASLQAARAPYLSVYAQIGRLPGVFKVTNSYLNRIQQLGGDLQRVAKEHPNIVNIDAIKKIQESLSTPTMAPQTAMMLIRQLRSDASSTLDRAFNQEKPSAEQIAVGKAQREAANAIEKMVEVNLRASGNAKMFRDFKNSRQYLAKSFDIESAVNPATGHIDPQKLVRIEQAAGNRRFTGPLSTAVRFAQGFPKSMRAPEKAANVTPYGLWQTLGASGAAATNHPLLAAGILSQPLLRQLALSQPVQAALTKGQP